MPTEWSATAETMGKVAAVLGAAWTLFRYGRRLYRRVRSTLEAIDRMAEDMPRQILDLERRIQSRLDALQSDVTTVKAETQPNGGNSMRDVLASVQRLLRIEQGARRALAQAFDYGAFEADDRGEWVWTNRALREMTGLSQSDALGAGWLSAVADDDRERVWEEWTSAVEHNRLFRTIVRLIHIDTEIQMFVQIEAWPIIDDRRKMIWWYGSVRETP